jgi:beta-glucuronidase
VGWYRKDFKLPSAASRLDWIVRFESVNYRSKVWLNGRPLGTHRGATCRSSCACRPAR